MIYLLTGENLTLIEEKITEIKSQFSDIPFTTQKNSTLQTWLEPIESCDMFSPQTGLISMDPKWIKQTTKETLPKLEHGLAIAKQFNIPVIITAKNIDKRSIVYKLLKKIKVTEHACPEFKEWETDKVIQWIQSYCQTKNISIKAAAVELLVNGYSSQLSIIKQELDKCMIAILPNTTISVDDIKNSTGSAIGIYNSLSNSIKDGVIDKMIEHTQHLITLKEDPHKIFNHYLFQINQLLPIALGIAQKMSSDTIASQLGKHPYFVKKQTQSIVKNPLAPKIRKIIPLLAQIDLDIKSGKLNSKQAIIKLITNLKYQI